MLINPDIEEWFNKLQGKSAGHGGSAPRGGGLPNYAEQAIQGIVRPSAGMYGFHAPDVRAKWQAKPELPVHQVPSPMGGTPTQGNTPSGGTPNLGGAAKAAGLEKLGQGVEQMFKAIAERRAASEAAQLSAGALASRNPGVQMPGPPGPLSKQMANNPGATMPNIAGAAVQSPAPYTPASVGAASEMPLAAQPGASGVQPIPPIGPGGGLPTFAQGMPRAADKSASLNSTAMIDPQYDPKGLGAGLQPRFADLLQDTLQDAGDRGINSHVISGLRTPAEQNKLYAQGRTAPGPIVTNAPAGSSFHNWGAAADVSGSPADLRAIGEAGKNLGLTWGGDFKSIADLDHLQMPGTLAEARAGQSQPIPPAPTSVAGGFNPIAGRTSDLGQAGSASPNRPTANLNPANLKYFGGSSGFAATHGATGADEKGFAIFPDAATGRAAQQALWNTSRYADVPLSSALKTWGGTYTPQQLGFQPNQTFSGMNPADQQRLLDTQARFEGWKPGSGGTQQAATPQPQPLTAPSAQTYAATPPTLTGPLAQPTTATNAPIPPPRPSGPQSMNEPGDHPQFTPISDTTPPLPQQPLGLEQAASDPGQSQLADALANGPASMPQLDQSAMLAMALNQGSPDMFAPPDVATPDFGGGMFGGGLSGLFG